MRGFERCIRRRRKLTTACILFVSIEAVACLMRSAQRTAERHHRALQSLLALFPSDMTGLRLRLPYTDRRRRMRTCLLTKNNSPSSTSVGELTKNAHNAGKTSSCPRQTIVPLLFSASTSGCKDTYARPPPRQDVKRFKSKSWKGKAKLFLRPHPAA